MGLSDPLAARALDGGRYLTPAESLEIFGTEIGVKYYNGNDYVDAVARYQGVDSVREIYWTDDTGYLVAGRQLLRYSFSASGIISNPDYITVDLSPQYSIFDTTMIYTSIGVTAPQQSISVYQSPSWIWNIAGEQMSFEAGSIADSQGLLQRYRLQSNTQHYVCFVPAYYNSQSTFSAYSLRATFSGAQMFSGSVEVLISVPYISSDASGSSGVVTTTSGSSGGGGDINVNVDMSETNGLLQTLINGVDGLLDGLIHLFVPTSDELSAWVDAMDDLLHDHLGGMYQAVDLIDSTFDVYGDVTAVSSFHVDRCDIPLAGATLTLGNWDVPLKSSALPQLFYDALAYIIDFLASVAFLNMLRRKLEIILNPDSEVVETDG